MSDMLGISMETFCVFLSHFRYPEGDKLCQMDYGTLQELEPLKGEAFFGTRYYQPIRRLDFPY